MRFRISPLIARHSRSGKLLAALLLGGMLLSATACTTVKPKAEFSSRFPAQDGQESHLITGMNGSEGDFSGTARGNSASGQAGLNGADGDMSNELEGVSAFVNRGNANEIKEAGMPIEALPNILFPFDSSELDQAARNLLQSHIQFLRENPNLQVVLRGHTDNRGTAEYNIVLGENRALTVRQYLLENGIANERIDTVSFGMDLPLVPEDTEDAHAQNRRVEFFVYELN